MPDDTAPDMDFSRRLFAALDQHWEPSGEGMRRPGYSPEESQGIGIIHKEAAALGMQGYRDLAGNAYFIYPGEDPGKPVVMMGSHLDAVPKGGRYDGPAGVVSALTAVKHLHDQAIKPPQDLCVVIWRNEESPWFNQFAVGSKLAMGTLKPDILDRPQRDDKKSLSAHMNAIGLDSAALRKAIEKGQPLIPLDRVGAMLEVHIEQGSELMEQNIGLGLVTGIRGNVRFPKMIQFEGEIGHTGTVPQGKRKDAARAGMVFGTLVADKFDEIIEAGRDLVYSFPEITTGPNASATSIAAYCAVRPEARSLDSGVLADAKSIYIQCAKEAALKTNTTLILDSLETALSTPSVMHPDLQSAFQDSAQQRDIQLMAMPSGAGHDTGVLAEKGIPSAMLFIRHGNNGVSHRPDEIMAMNAEDDPFSLRGDFCNAVTLLAEAAKTGVSIRNASGPSFSEALCARGATPLKL